MILLLVPNTSQPMPRLPRPRHHSDSKKSFSVLWKKLTKIGTQTYEQILFSERAEMLSERPVQKPSPHLQLYVVSKLTFLSLPTNRTTTTSDVTNKF